MLPNPSLAVPSRPTSQHHLESGKPVASATYLRPAQMRLPSPRKALFAMPKEPEDAGITGGTRSLDRRLLALNLTGIRSQLDRLRPGIGETHPTAA
jgi:hypothetical protein